MKRAYDETLALPCPRCGHEGLTVFHNSKRKHPTTTCPTCSWSVELPLSRVRLVLNLSFYGA
ncbi:MAG: hypothetical protein AB7G08_33380 [Hyphomicrobiaceae bacterium]